MMFTPLMISFREMDFATELMGTAYTRRNARTKTMMVRPDKMVALTGMVSTSGFLIVLASGPRIEGIVGVDCKNKKVWNFWTGLALIFVLTHCKRVTLGDVIDQTQNIEILSLFLG